MFPASAFLVVVVVAENLFHIDLRTAAELRILSCVKTDIHSYHLNSIAIKTGIHFPINSISMEKERNRDFGK